METLPPPPEPAPPASPAALPPAFSPEDRGAPLNRLHPAVRWVWLGACGILFLVLLVAGLIADVVVRKNIDGWTWPVGTIGLGASVVLTGLAVIYSMLRYASWGYLLREQDVVIQSGVLWKVRRCVPRSRVQHVDITSSPLGRAFGLVEVHLYTAGALGAVAEIEGLSPEAAEQLRLALVRSSSDGV